MEKKQARLEQEISEEDCHSEILFSMEDNQKELEVVKIEIDRIIEHKTRGALIRTRRGWETHGEKNCAYFYNLEKFNYMSKNRFKLETDTGEIVTDPQKKLNMQKAFYETLYKADGMCMSVEYLQDLTVKKLSELQKSNLE